MSKVRWSFEEQEKLYTAAMELWKSAPGISILEAVRSVQKQVLPKERQRRLRFIQMVSPTLRKRLDSAMTAAVQQPAAASEPASVPLPAVELPKPDPLDDAIGALADHLAELVYKRLRMHLQQRAEGLLQAVANAATHSDTQRKRKVMVIGGTGQQAAILQQEFGKLLDLRFKSSDTATPHVVASAVEMDHVLAWTDFISHHMTEALTAANVKYIAVRGGMSAVREKLTEIYVL